MTTFLLLSLITNRWIPGLSNDMSTVAEVLCGFIVTTGLSSVWQMSEGGRVTRAEFWIHVKKSEGYFQI